MATNATWVHLAKQVFGASKPQHSTSYTHCCECFEHDEILRLADVDRIGLQEIGSAAWDPRCFSSPAGIKYYLPARIRLTLDNIETLETNYLEQFLNHLILDGEGNRLVSACDLEQKEFVVKFRRHLIENHRPATDETMSSNDVSRALKIWSA